MSGACRAEVSEPTPSAWAWAETGISQILVLSSTTSMDRVGMLSNIDRCPEIECGVINLIAIVGLFRRGSDN